MADADGVGRLQKSDIGDTGSDARKTATKMGGWMEGGGPLRQRSLYLVSW